MSNVSNRATIQTFVSGVSKPLSGQVLVKATYKETRLKDGTVIPAKPGFCASVPKLADDAILAAAPKLIKQLRSIINAARTNILRTAAERGESSIAHDALDLDACLVDISSTNYIKPEDFRAWFASVLPQHRAWVFATITMPEGQDGQNKYELLRDKLAGGIEKMVCKQKGASFPEALRRPFLAFVSTLDASTLADTIGEQLIEFAEAQAQREEDMFGGLGG